MFNLTQGSTLPSGNYGTLTLTLTGAGAITVDIQLTNGAIINGGQGCSICFNSSLTPDPNINFSALTLGYGGVGGNTNVAPSSLHGDGFGFFEYGVNYLGNTGGGCTTDPTPCLGHVTFTVSKVGGTFSSVFNLVQNSTGGGIASPFAVDIVINPGTAQAATGYVGTGTSPVPEPTSMLLLGTGLIGIAGEVRRRFKSRRPN
jgi:hypothetical protein